MVLTATGDAAMSDAFEPKGLDRYICIKLPFAMGLAWGLMLGLLSLVSVRNEWQE